MDCRRKVGAGALAIFGLAACDFGLPPRPEWPAAVPSAAKLEYLAKTGWVWEHCIDGPSGSALLSWANGSRSFTQLRPVSCEAAGRDRRDFLRAEGSPGQIAFMFPERPDAFTRDSSSRECPQEIAPEALAAFRSTMEAVIASDKLTPEARADAEGFLETLRQVRTEELQLSGGIGNAEAWSVRCT